jgi:hypothetical protein
MLPYRRPPRGLKSCEKWFLAAFTNEKLAMFLRIRIANGVEVIAADLRSTRAGAKAFASGEVFRYS